MAKAANPAPVSASEYEFVDAPAPSLRGPGAKIASPDVATLDGMPAPNAAGKCAYKFFALSAAPATITDATEIAKWTKDEGRKQANRFSGITRRLIKKDAAKAFAIRVTEKNGQPGIGVWRISKAVATVAPASA